MVSNCLGYTCQSQGSWSLRSISRATSQVEIGTGKNYDIFRVPEDRKWEMKTPPSFQDLNRGVLSLEEVTILFLEGPSFFPSSFQGMDKRFSQSAQR
jgi:hypothetical protein